MSRRSTSRDILFFVVGALVVYLALSYFGIVPGVLQPQQGLSLSVQYGIVDEQGHTLMADSYDSSEINNPLAIVWNDVNTNNYDIEIKPGYQAYWIVQPTVKVQMAQPTNVRIVTTSTMTATYNGPSGSQALPVMQESSKVMTYDFTSADFVGGVLDKTLSYQGATYFSLQPVLNDPPTSVYNDRKALFTITVKAEIFVNNQLTNSTTASMTASMNFRYVPSTASISIIALGVSPGLRVG